MLYGKVYLIVMTKFFGRHRATVGEKGVIK